jgi:uncharacterized protein (DUF4415 family)
MNDDDDKNPQADPDRIHAQDVEVLIDQDIIQAFRERYGDGWKEAIERALTRIAFGIPGKPDNSS